MTREAFRRKLKIKLALSAVIAAVGAVTVALAFAAQSGETGHLSSFMNGFYFGTGGGLTGAGIATAVTCVLYLRRPDLFEKKFIAETDERNRFILLRSGFLAFFICLYLVYLAVIVTGLFLPQAAVALLAVLGGMAFVFLVVSLVCKRLY